MSYLRVLMSFALVVSAEAYANDFPEVSIRQVRALNDDGDGSALEAELVRVTGVTTTSGRQYAPTSNCDNPPCTPGVGFYLDDGEAGIFVWSYLPSGGIDGLTVGQRVRVGGLAVKVFRFMQRVMEKPVRSRKIRVGFNKTSDFVGSPTGGNFRVLRSKPEKTLKLRSLPIDAFSGDRPAFLCRTQPL